MLPHDLPPYRIVFHYYRTWRRDGTWQQVNDALCRQTRQSQGPKFRTQRRHYRQPIGENHRKRGPRCYNDGKRVMGRKRHNVVDTGGLLLAVVVHPPDVRTGTAPYWC